MKTHLIAIMLLTLFVLGILPGCSAASTGQQNAPVKSPESSLSNVPGTANAPVSVPAAPQQITAEDAESIALSKAGVNRADVRYMRTEFDYDDGVPEYDVEFRSDNWEYEFEIHAESGRILSQSKKPNDK